MLVFLSLCSMYVFYVLFLLRLLGVVDLIWCGRQPLCFRRFLQDEPKVQGLCLSSPRWCICRGYMYVSCFFARCLSACLIFLWCTITFFSVAYVKVADDRCGVEVAKVTVDISLSGISIHVRLVANRPRFAQPYLHWFVVPACLPALAATISWVGAVAVALRCGYSGRMDDADTAERVGTYLCVCLCLCVCVWGGWGVQELHGCFARVEWAFRWY